MGPADVDENGRPYYTESPAPEPPIRIRLAEAMAELAGTDYYALKYIDGELSEGEYAAVRKRRARLRERVRKLEAEQTAGIAGGEST